MCLLLLCVWQADNMLLGAIQDYCCFTLLRFLELPRNVANAELFEIVFCRSAVLISTVHYFSQSLRTNTLKDNGHFNYNSSI
jgi:hypothetical protein